MQDLKDLAEAGVTINITTFLALNPNELQVRPHSAAALVLDKGTNRGLSFGSTAPSHLQVPIFLPFKIFFRML